MDSNIFRPPAPIDVQGVTKASAFVAGTLLELLVGMRAHVVTDAAVH